MKLLINNLYNLYNIGEAYHVLAIRNAFPQAEITIDGLYSHCNPRICDNLDLKWMGEKHQSSMVTIILGLLKRLIYPRQYDLVIDLGGDTFSEKPMKKYALAHALTLLPYALHHRKYVIISQSIGKFGLTKPISCYVLKNAREVVVRDSKSHLYLNSIGIQNKLAQDLAYGIFYDRN